MATVPTIEPSRSADHVFAQLSCSRGGLSSEAARLRLITVGSNRLFVLKKRNVLMECLAFLWNPLSWGMELAALMSIALANGGGEPPNWEDFLSIVALLAFHCVVRTVENSKTMKAEVARAAALAPKTKVIRDGLWSEREAAVLVPGDVIRIKPGDIIPADAFLLEGDPILIDEAQVTGIDLFVTKNPGDKVFSGSTCMQGEMEAVVFGTGTNTLIARAGHVVNGNNQVEVDKVLEGIGNFCICCIALGITVEIIVMYLIQHREYRDGIDNLLVLLLGGIPMAMPNNLSAMITHGLHLLCEQGAIAKHTTAIKKMAGMDVLCCDRTGTLTLNELTVDKDLIAVFAEDVDKDRVLLLGARASLVENQDEIDACIVGMLADPKKARADIAEVHFSPFDPVSKRSTITYTDSDGNWHQVSKGAPEQIVDLCVVGEDVKKKVQDVIDEFADRGLLSIAVAERISAGPWQFGGPWQFVGLLPLLYPPRHDSAESIRQALHLGVHVKMTTGDQLAVVKETGRRLGMGTNMLPSSSLPGQHMDESIAALPIDELIDKADGFAGVLPGQKYGIVTRLKKRKHICGMTGHGPNDAKALKKADIGIAVANATDAARGASDIVLTKPGLSAIVSAVLTSRGIFQRMTTYDIYTVSIIIRFVLGFLLLALIWKHDFSPFMVSIIAILSDFTVTAISRDRAKPSPVPDSWKLREIFATGIVLGTYLAATTVVFFWAAHKSNFFSDKFGVRSIRDNPHELTAAVFLQVSIGSQALLFAVPSRSWSCLERPGFWLMSAFVLTQLMATLLTVYANWGFAKICGIGWGWAGVIWLWCIMSYIPLDILKFTTQKALCGKAWETTAYNVVPC